MKKDAQSVERSQHELV